MRGRKQIPTALKLLRGNPGKRALNPDEAKPERVKPEPPEWLDAAAREEWGRLVPELETLGLATRIDRQSLGCYCQAVSRLAAAEKLIAEEGLTVESKYGQARHPAVAIAKDAAEHVRKFAVEFGLTPSARSRIHVQSKPAKSKFETFLGDKKQA